MLNWLRSLFRRPTPPPAQPVADDGFRMPDGVFLNLRKDR